MKKRFLVLLLTMLVVTTLAACATSEQRQPDTGGTTTQEKTQKEQANLELTQVAFDTAKAELISGNYDVALAAFKEVEFMLSVNNIEGFDDIEAYKYACNYYRLSEYLSGFSSSAEYKVDENFSVFGYDGGDDGLLFNYEGTSYTGGYYSSAINGMVPIAATFNNFMIVIPAPDKSNPQIPETIEWTYTASDALNGFSRIAKASGTFNPQDWFTIKRLTSDSISIGAIIEILELEGDEEILGRSPKQYCVSFVNFLNDFLSATQLDLTVADLGIKDVTAASNEFVKNN